MTRPLTGPYSIAEEVRFFPGSFAPRRANSLAERVLKARKTPSNRTRKEHICERCKAGDHRFNHTELGCTAVVVVEIRLSNQRRRDEWVCDCAISEVNR